MTSGLFGQHQYGDGISPPSLWLIVSPSARNKAPIRLGSLDHGTVSSFAHASAGVIGHQAGLAGSIGPGTMTLLRRRENLSTRLRTLLRLFAEFFEVYGWEDAATQERFRNDLLLLVADYGPSAVEAALDDIPDDSSPPIAPP